jgi:hypothetical protein
VAPITSASLTICKTIQRGSHGCGANGISAESGSAKVRNRLKYEVFISFLKRQGKASKVSNDIYESAAGIYPAMAGIFPQHQE